MFFIHSNNDFYYCTFYLLLTGERTFGVLTKLDLMDQGTNALDVKILCSHSLYHEIIV